MSVIAKKRATKLTYKYIFISILIAFLASVFPSLIAGWLFSKEIALWVFTISLILITFYLVYAYKEDKSDTLTILFDDKHMQLEFYINQDLIRSIPVEDKEKISSLIQKESKELKSIIDELICQVNLVNIDKQDAPKFIGTNKVL